jgi:hypothetical protein
MTQTTIAPSTFDSNLNADAAPSLFEQAARVFETWESPGAKGRLLCLYKRRQEDDPMWSTHYHQVRCFLDGGRKITLKEPVRGTENTYPRRRQSVVLDLTTGEATRPFPSDSFAVEVIDETKMAALIRWDDNGPRAALWDMEAERELASVGNDGWKINCINMLSDGRRALVFLFKGKTYDQLVHSKHILLTPGEPPRVVMDVEGYFCSHVQGCPTDPDLYAFDRWPSPYHEIEQAIHLRTIDGGPGEPLRMQPDTLRPGDTWGARDHYVWTPDGNYIVSYLCPRPMNLDPNFNLGPDFNHFKLEWWLSATNWRTGEDYAAPYPPGRFGGHMQMTPDSRTIVNAGGPGFDKLYAVDLQGLSEGWNEHIICDYPETTGNGQNNSPFPQPWVLPDGSGVIFNAGWPGPEHGVYLAEWNLHD